MSCPGKRPNGSKCGKIVYVCKHCGSVGCDQGRRDECGSQNFLNAKCLKCGKPGAKGKHL